MGEKIPHIRLVVSKSYLPVKRLLESSSDVIDDILPISEGMEPGRTTGTQLAIGMTGPRFM